jgi:hypothetical protein
MISAWSCDRRLVLAQIAATAKSSESRAGLKLLEFQPQRDAIVTTGALNCQRDMARRIVDQGG